MIGPGKLIFIALLLTTVSLLVFRCTVAQTPSTVKMYIVNSLTGDNTFNVSDYTVGSVFTAEFYVGNVTNMITWQIHVTYNRTIINYAKAWFPDDNVFKQAIDSGAVPMKDISVNVDNATDVGDLLIVMTCTYHPGSLPDHPVSVASKGLLCRVNFTITQHPTLAQLVFVTQQTYSSLHVAPPYYLGNFQTSVQTLNGTYLADGEPAVIYDVTATPEGSILLLWIGIPIILALILARRRTKRCNYDH